MSYTDMLVHTKTKERLKRFADSKGLNIAQLLEHICDLLEKNKSPVGVTHGHTSIKGPNIQQLPKESKE